MPARPHEEIVAHISRQLSERARSGQPAHIAKNGVSHFVPLPGDRRAAGRPIDVSALDRILSVDAGRKVCVAEPGATFAEVVAATLPEGLIPAVVPELEGITLGGAVAGCSVESMSFRHGGFHDSCLEYEVVTGSGEVVTCSREREPQVFHMTHGSYGTLGVLTRLSFKLVPARPFVRLEYRRFPTAEAFREQLLERCRAGDFDFVDGIVHGPDHYVACLGRFVDEAPRVSRYRLEPFYKSTARLGQDWLSTPDYLFRFDADCHWLTRGVPPLEWKPVRAVLGPAVLGSGNLIRWSKRLEGLLALKKRPDVVCDVFIPSREVTRFFDWYARAFDYWPVWVVPYRAPEPYPWLAPERAARLSSDFAFDCAIYGKPNGGEVDFSALLEEKTYELGGVKTLIGRNHYSPERFWTIYSRENYQAAKRRLDPAGVFPGVYEKFHRA